MTAGEWIQLGTLVILIFTLGAVSWYACEARRQVTATRRLSEVALQPILAHWIPIDRWPVPGGGVRFLYQNIGNGPALNIQWQLGHFRDERVAMGIREENGPLILGVPGPAPFILVAEYDDADGNRWRSTLEVLERDGLLQNGTATYGRANP